MDLRTRLAEPGFWVRVHTALTVAWVLLLAPSILFWQESIPYLVFMSAWANVAGSAASLQSARADRNSPAVEDLRRIEQGQATHVAAVLALQRKVDMLIKRVG